MRSNALFLSLRLMNETGHVLIRGGFLTKAAGLSVIVPVVNGGATPELEESWNRAGIELAESW